jgi:hypothetical protein
MSAKIDEARISDIYLTLATWQPHQEYPKSYEIGFRSRYGFVLIQFRMPSRKAWDIVKRLTAKGRFPDKIQKVLDRLER